MSDVKMSLFFSFLGTCLPNMRAKHLATRSKDQMRTCVVSLKLVTTLRVYRAVHCLSDQIGVRGQLLIDFVQDALSNLDDVDYIVDNINAFDRHRANIVCLAT